MKNGTAWPLLPHISGTASALEVCNSALSDTAEMGFEYGSGIAAADTLVPREAQFGDFVNLAQPIVDQFTVADRAKWAQDSGIVLLLPYGYEGRGPNIRARGSSGYCSSPPRRSSWVLHIA